jgi:predicted esterase YcpF (UPF0227 family)
MGTGDHDGDLAPRRLRVLFMHGLESGPKGNKARLLREHFELQAPDMEVSTWRLDRRRSVTRCVSTRVKKLNMCRQQYLRPRASAYD